VPEVSVYVAVVTAGAAVVGAAISQIPGLVRDIRQADQARRERNACTKRQACIDLLGAARDLLTQVANAADYHGEEMADRLAEIRKVAAAVHTHAANVELLAPDALAEPAVRLAGVADRFAADAAANTDLQLHQMVTAPDPTELGEAIEAFRKQAVADAGK
jgi:hypothetical protein